MFDSLLDIFRKVSPERIARRQLHQAQVDLLEAEAWAEHYSAIVKTCAARIARLDIRMADTPAAGKRVGPAPVRQRMDETGPTGSGTCRLS